MTRQGVILGTAAYMSPEQARGQAVDKRTDIWAFGCVLYEMLTGRVAFKGDTVSDTIVAILDREPGWDELPTATPASVRLLLQRCLEKDPKRRLRDIGDARLEIEQLLGRSVGGAAAPRARQWRPGYRAGLGVLALVVLAAGAGLFYLAKHSGPVTSPSEYTQLTNFTDSAVAPALSPDGRMVTFMRGGEFFYSSGQIYVKLLPNGESVRLTNDADGKYRAGVHAGRLADRVYRRAHHGRFRGLGYLDRSRARGPADAVPAQRVWSHLDRRAPGALFRDQDRDRRPHGDRDRDGQRGPKRGRSIFRRTSSRWRTTHTRRRIVNRCSSLRWTNPTRSINRAGCCHSMEAHRAGRSALRAPARQPPGLRTERGCILGRGLDAAAHLWRQKFPDGRPEQITFGPIEEEGVALAPDGRSLVTSAGNRRSGIWIHDAAGERAISSEGYALAPRLSRDGTRVFYLFAQDLVAWYLGWRPASAELRSVDLVSGKTDSVLPGVSVADYEVSHDEKEVAFTTTDSSAESHIWLAPLDRRTPPRQIAHGGDSVSFGADGDLVFRSLEGTKNFLVRIKKDGTGRERVSATPIMDKFGVSPDGAWALTLDAGAGGDVTLGMFAVPLHGGGAPRRICPDCQSAVWSSDGKFLYAAVKGRTLAIPVPAGKSLPDLPASGISLAETEGLPGATVIEHGAVSPGPAPSTYVFVKTDLRRNLFRIPLH